jgi:1-acyl-sn-glycerol-3-phosphate acyltransferase
MIAVMAVTRASGDSANAPGPRVVTRGSGNIRDIFLGRLGDLEDRVGRELGRSGVPLGPAGEFALDALRSTWGVGASLFSSLSSSAGRRDLLVSWTASAPVDELGFDRQLAETVHEIVRPIARRWLGVVESRSAGLPERGGVLVLMNRSGWPVPIEPLVLASMLSGRAGSRPVAVLWEPDLPELPLVSDFLRRIGIVAATVDNAACLLERGFVVLCFPEGRAARQKTYDRRYRLARFEFVDGIEAAIATGARIVPAAIAGNEDSFPILGQLAGMPITAQFPLLGVFGVLPLPGRWTIRIGSPLEIGQGSDAGAVSALADASRARMQALLGQLLSER